ncbi:GNAT family N-acetyltransferase [Bacillus spongiae]|uniref:GNAT family N-acetyltransferase n=1 Tax=Bacillus spongiae TaxID=2683610 RepID=A0ABU8HFL6_9BACI
MKIKLKELTVDNWEECIGLSVSDQQKSFVADNSYSLLESKFWEGLYPLAIYYEELMVGFLMYGIESETGRMEMSRFMIDEKYQGKGYGRLAIQQLLELVRKKIGSIEFYTSAEPDNVNAIKLYESIGFEKTGEIMWDEIVLKIQL